MLSRSAAKKSETAEATVTSKGQITLPKVLRRQLGIDTGSRIRFTIQPGGFQADRVLYDLEDLWEMADSGPKAKRAMSLEEMNRAKARRKW